MRFAIAGLVFCALAPAQSHNVQTATLSNGMKILIEEDHGIPNVAMYFFYRIGSRNERPGITGISHFFEHMMFNGAKKYGPKQFDIQMEKAGGENNASTSNDLTVYTDWFPNTALELMMDMESDRIRDLAFDPKIIESERGVVYSERRSSVDNSNAGTLSEQLRAAAFIAHPYHWPVLGWPSDIESWTMDDLKSYFKIGYAPNNCTMVLVGDVSTANVLALARKYIEPIPRQDPPPPVRTKEPPQLGERRVVVRKAAQLPLQMIAYHVPEAKSPDTPALEVVAALLARGESSRLYQRMVDRDQLALSANVGKGDTFDPTIMTFTIQPRSGIDPAQTEKALYEELERLQSTAVESEELQKAKNELLAAQYRQMKTIAGRANLLGRYEVLYGDYAKLFSMDKEIQAVSAQDIQRVARTYFTEKNRTVATLLPEGAGAAGGAGKTGGRSMKPLVGVGLMFAIALPQFAQVKLLPYTREVLPNGVVVALIPRTGVPLVHFHVLVKGGSESDPPQMAGLASVTAQLLRRGTAKRTAERFSADLDFLGGTFTSGFDTGGSSVAITAEFLAKDFDRGLDLLSDALLHPSFPQDEVAKEIARRVDQARTAKDNPGAAIRSYFQTAFFGRLDPRGNLPDEITLARIQRNDILEQYRKLYCGKNMIVSVAGDFDPAAAKTKLAQTFGAAPAGTAFQWVPEPAPPRRAQMLLIDKPDATQTYFIIGQPGIDRRNPDRETLELVNTVFGGRFLSMLNEELRVNTGLTYGANSQVEQMRLPGAIAISTYTKTETTARAIDLALEVLKRLNEKGLTAEQLESAKAYMKGQYPTRQLETIDQLANVVGEIEMYDLGRVEVDGLFSRIDAVTLAQVNAAARKYYRTDNLTLVLLGAADKIRDSVKKYDPHMVEMSVRDPGWGAR